MIRMEIACLIVLAFMAVLHCTSKGEKTKLHRMFFSCLIVSIIHLIFDGITIFTVNQLDSVPRWLNDLVHRIFIGSMIVVFYLVYRYLALLIEDDIEEKLHISGFSSVLLVAGMICSAFLPLVYIETPYGNYSYGPFVYQLYIIVFIYISLTIWILKKFWNKMQARKKIMVAIAMSVEVVGLVFQAIYPYSLISGIGIMFVNLVFYLVMENPDIALVQQVQKEKKKADEANAAKSLFLSHMSHEIRTPMNAVVGMTEILLRTELTEEQREYLNNIKSSGNALVSIINDILDISKIEAGKMRLVEDVYEIRTVLKDVQMIVENRIGDKQIEFICEIDHKMPRQLYGDSVRVRQVLINLLNNAIKFTSEGQIKLVVRAEFITVEEVQLYVSVSDTGQGIKEEDLKKLFISFSQVDVKKNQGKEGTGLGLSISRKLIEMMGGTLDVSSTYGAGSNFYFCIWQKLATAEMISEEENEWDGISFITPDAKVLIVDDNEMNLKVAKGLLAPLQMHIETADSGKKALEMVKNQSYHLIFMDHMMPVMDGVETTRYIRAMEGSYFKEVPIVALTASVMKEAEKLFYEVGMNAFLSKPIDMRQMCMVLAKWLPEELIIKQSESEIALWELSNKKTKEVDLPVIEGIDSKEGLKNCGTLELFKSLLGDFYKLIDIKSMKIIQCVETGAIRDYTIEVHALKNTSRMIGAMELSQRFLRLEELGNASDYEAINLETSGVIDLYRSYKPILRPYGESEELPKKEVVVEEIIAQLEKMKGAMEMFDIDGADEAMAQLEQYQIPKECQKMMDDLRVYIADVAMEEVISITEEIIVMLKKDNDD